MALPQKVKRSREPSFRNSSRIHGGTQEVDDGQSQKRAQPHHFAQRSEAILDAAVSNRRKQARPQETIHQEPSSPVAGLSKLGLQRENGATQGSRADGQEIEPSQLRVTAKSKVNARYPCPPHDKDDAEVVELVAKAVHLRRVVRECMENCREGEANHHAEIVDRYGHHVTGASASAVSRESSCLNKLNEAVEEMKGPEQMRPDVGFDGTRN